MIPTGQTVKRISKAAIAFVGWVWLGGCSLIMEEPQPLEPANGVFYYDPHPAAMYSAYGVKLPERRMIRQVIVHSREPLRGMDIYVRERVDSWKHVKARKVMDAGPTRINVRATGDTVHIIPKTHALGAIIDVDVFAVPKEVAPNVK